MQTPPLTTPSAARLPAATSNTPAPLTSSAPVAIADPPWRNRKDTEAEAALARDAGRLVQLRSAPPGQRATCAQFRSLELQRLFDEADRSQGVINGCSPAAAALVKCVETPTGFFVPVGVAFDLCSYRLWFVPRTRDQQPVPVSEVLAEFDLQFTVRLAVDDLDADGTFEVLLVRGWSHPEGVGEGQSIFVVEPTGEQRTPPFDDIKDVDGDGRHDAVISFARTRNGAGCEPPDKLEAWVPITLYGPELVLHRALGGKFSLTDPVARAARAKGCENLGTDVVARRAGAVNEDETQRRAVCRLADGEDPAPIRQALEKACWRDYEMPQDCRKKRPGVCQWRADLLGLPSFFESLSPWLAGG